MTLRRPTTRAQRAIVAALAGALLVLAIPPMPVALAWLALPSAALLAFAIDGAAPRDAAIAGLAFGLVVNASVLSFVPTPIERFTDLPKFVAILAMLLLSVAESIAWMIALGMCARAQRRGAPFVVVFSAAVLFAHVCPHLFSWTFATPLSRAPVALQLAELVGERGVAAIVAAVGALAIGGPRSRFTALAIVVAMFLYGGMRMRAVEATRASSPRLSIGLVQHAIPPRERWDPSWAATIVARLGERSREAQNRGAQLVVWPEGAYPYELSRGQTRDNAARRIRPAGVGIEILAGVLAGAAPLDDDRAPGVVPHLVYNAATLVHRDGALSPIAAKLALLPFGESVPFGEEFPVLRRIFARGEGTRPGRDVVVLATQTDPAARVGVLNCYEDTLAYVARRVALARPTLLANVTNDAWFDGTREAELHLLAAIPRAIELRRDLVRAVNTGVSAHVSATGLVEARTDDARATTLMVSPAILDAPPTIYAYAGDLLPTIACALSMIAASLIFRLQKPKSVSTA